MALVAYEPHLTMREARARYFAANGFGETGGYDAPTVTVKLGPLPLTIPNTAGRVRAVRYHDLHHVLTGYDTDLAGEFEISAFEIGAGCKDFYAAWALNLGGVTGGLLRWPRRTLRAFVRGRHSQSLYGEALEPLLALSVAEARLRMGCPDRAPPARATDLALFALTAAAGLVTGLALVVVAAPLTPLVFVLGVTRKPLAAP